MSTSVTTLQLNDISVEVLQKPIKNIHLSVYPPIGRVKVSAPEEMALESIRLFVISKMGWIRQQQKKLQAQDREAPREYLGRESHFFRGKRYLLEIIEQDSKPKVTISHTKILLHIRPDSTQAKMQMVLDDWYRVQMKKTLPSLFSHWEERLGVSVAKYSIRRMKTKWGSCSPTSRSIIINLELAKKPPEYLEYIVVHELVHLLEPTHGQNFIRLLDKHLPRWRTYREELNALPLHHIEWSSK